jgi:hypothetical protein
LRVLLADNEILIAQFAAPSFFAGMRLSPVSV